MSFQETKIETALSHSSDPRYYEVDLYFTSPVAEGLVKSNGNPWNPANLLQSITSPFKPTILTRQVANSKFVTFMASGKILNIFYSSCGGKLMLRTV